MRFLPAVSVLVLAAACASAGRFIPATDRSITSGLALGDSQESAGDVWVDNRSSTAITVISVTLHECVNVEQACSTRFPMNVRIEPDTREFVFHARRKVFNDSYRFTFFTEWRPDSVSKPAPGAH